MPRPRIILQLTGLAAQKLRHCCMHTALNLHLLLQQAKLSLHIIECAVLLPAGSLVGGC
jgi:hypothetical protein